MKDYIKEILINARDGDEVAFGKLYELYQNSVFTKANQVLCNEADAQDVVQETFLIVHKKLHQLRDIDLFYSWLMSITMSRCHMQFRKEKHYSKYDEHILIEQKQEDRIYLNPEKTAHNESEREILIRLIQSLSPKKAEIIQLFYLEEMKLNEIAAHLNISVNTVKTRLKRARDELQKAIQSYEKNEQIKLHFHADMIIPTSLLGTGLIGHCIQIIQYSCNKIVSYMKTHVVMSGCYASMVILSVSGSVFLVQDQETQRMAQQSQSIMQNHENTVKKEGDEITLPMNRQKALYQPTSYMDKSIRTAREAYYICINFAVDEDDMKLKSTQEMNEILPVYESLKQSESPYYKSLVEDHWSELFERYDK